MAATAGEAVFVDTNVLVYSSLARSPLHGAAVQTLNSLRADGGELWISRQVLREYIAVISRPHATTLADPLATAIGDVRAYQSLFRIAEDGPTVTGHLLSLLTAIPCLGKQVHDANIVATMLAHGLSQLLTHNTRDFSRFAAQITVIPLVP
ncbi:type II toxin-antitoxin system VapC family toxin [PVC group bacterium]|nr:type II toxin-antitoxin system VapC family toxin [PVC group bacterium]